MMSIECKCFKSLTTVGLFSLLCLIAVCAIGCGRGSDDPYSGEMVMYGTTSRIRGFDPVRSGDVGSAMAIGKIYEGLVQYSYLDRPYKVIPNLAASMPDISSDGLVYTFKIRSGIYFQDDPCFALNGGKGRELSAEDFVYSIKRVADLKNRSVGYWVYNNRISGLDEFREKSGGSDPTDYDMDIEGLKAIDKYTFRIKLTKPYPQLIWILTMPYGFALPREAVEYYGEDVLNHPVGTGPFVLKSWRRNYRVEFVRNLKWIETGRMEYYPATGDDADAAAGLLDDAGMRLPFLDRIVQYVISDQSTEWLKFVTGELDSTGISRENWDAVITQQGMLADSLVKRGVRLYKSPTLNIFYVGFNMDDPVVGSVRDDPEEDLRHKKLRQALSCAFNSSEWVQFWNERVMRAKGPIPPSVAGYEEKESPYPFDLAKAVRLMEEAGYPGGISRVSGKRLKLNIELGSADTQTMEAMDLLGAFMQKIGVILVPSYNNWPTFLQKMERRQAQLYRLGWVADYPDAENFLQLFYGENCSPGPNHSNYNNEDFNKLYMKIRAMGDGPERTRLYVKMSDTVVEDCPWIFTDHPMSFGLHNSWVKNYKPHDFPYGMTKYKKIDVDAKKEWALRYGRTDWQE